MPVPSKIELERVREGKTWIVQETNGHPVKVFSGKRYERHHILARIHSWFYLHFVERMD